MQKVTEADFEKVRKYIAIAQTPTTESRNVFEEMEIVVQAYSEALPAMIFLVDYYYTVVDKEANEILFNEPPHVLTKRDDELTKLNYRPRGYGPVVIAKLLEDAIQHYKQSARDRLLAALDTKLTDMTGEQLIQVLQENDRRQKEGIDLVIATIDGDGKTVYSYRNPYYVLAKLPIMPNTPVQQTKQE